MQTPPTPSRWSFARVIGPAFILLAALLTPVAVVLTHAHAELTDEESFVQTFSPLADDREVQAQMVAMAMAEIDVPGLVQEASKGLEEVGIPRPDLPPLRVPKWLSDSAEFLDGLGAPGWLTDPLARKPGESTATIESLTDLAVESLEAGIDSALTSLINTPQFSIAWEETLRASHSQVVEQLTSASAGSATSGAPLRIDIQPIIAATREALIEDGADFARYIPDLADWEYSAVLLPSEQMEMVGPFVSWILRFGSFVVWVPVALFTVGLLFARNRPAWLFVGGLFTVITAIITREVVTAGAVQDWTHSRLDPLSAAAASALMDTSFPPAASSLVTVAIIGTVLVTIGGLFMLLPRRGSPQTARG